MKRSGNQAVRASAGSACGSGGRAAARAHVPCWRPPNIRCRARARGRLEPATHRAAHFPLQVAQSGGRQRRAAGAAAADQLADRRRGLA